jgi:SAM-dependent methyltransferase
VCAEDDLGVDAWEERVDLALAIHVVHEAPDPTRFLAQVHRALKPGGRLLLMEPPKHVPVHRFRRILDAVDAAGFVDLAPPRRPTRQSGLFAKPRGICRTWPIRVRCHR